MTKKHLAAILFTALLTGVVETSTALELSQYNKLDTVSHIVNDSEVTDNLKKTLGNNYQTFIDNFDVFGEPHTITGGGLFVEGWLKDLYQENASAMVINPDGKIFAAWVVPASDVIHYQSTDNSPAIHADIQQWAARFNTMHFATFGQSKPAFDGEWVGEFENDSTLTLRLAESDNRITGSYCYISQRGNRIDCPEDDEQNLSGTIAGNRANVEFNSSFGGVGGRAVLEIKGREMEWRLITPPQKGNYYAPLRYTLSKAASVQNAETRKLDTDKFAISLINKCGHFERKCDEMVYLGVRKSDNSTISLMGKTLRDSAGKIIGSTYNNGEIVYTVTYAPVKLVVSKGNHVLVEQSGQWLK
ncbi:MULTISPECIES: hypothetical protein [Enterobacter]|uniref:hypothetical protein n=1 Tax=Enterobacter TaxID=547 RepID=UPI000D1D3C71|nr:MULTISPECIES: hypothetical protein [Enterobacter]MBE3512801.1 hypothetical protein [Enterobacter cloacae complex sp. I2]MBJ6385774.1 hypothetical protein [Enterobacter cloacae]MBJ6404086.1 hypothetical protein [Enterobacter cloacae]MBJ6435363.1 hypothetical protein [Enterobacter cloacae]MBJ6458941.1 hypothetical protein [Enterobacter cloacae]